MKWAPDFPWGVTPEEWDAYLARLVEIWGDDDHGLEIFEDRGEHALKGVPEKWRLYLAAPATF